MTRYRLDASALADLESIYDYVAARNIPAAVRLMDTFHEKFRLLASEPFLGQLQPELAPNLRSLVVGNYVIFYRPKAGGVEIARVLYSARDLQADF